MRWLPMIGYDWTMIQRFPSSRVPVLFLNIHSQECQWKVRVKYFCKSVPPKNPPASLLKCSLGYDYNPVRDKEKHLVILMTNDIVEIPNIP